MTWPQPHGEFDWQKLPGETQDEYDSLCADLDRLQDSNALGEVAVTGIAHRRQAYRP